MLMTNYQRIRRAVLNRDVCLSAAILFVFLACLVSYTAGRIHGFDAGQFFTEKNIEHAIEEAAAEGHDFRLKNINIKFMPRAEDEVQVAKTGEGQ